MVRIAFSALLTLFCLSAIHAQSPFKDKKDEKFYKKIDNSMLTVSMKKFLPTKKPYSPM